MAAGTIPAAITSDTAAPASSVWPNPASSVRTASGARRIRSRSFVAMPERPLRADERPEQVRPLVPHRQLDQLAVGQHDLRAQHMVDREAVLQAVRASRVLGDVAADRADLLRRRVGRVVEAVRRDRRGHVEVRDARLDDDLATLDIDLDHACEPRQRDHDALGNRQRTTREASSGAACDERDPVRVADANDRLYFTRALRNEHQRGRHAVARQAIAVIGSQLLEFGDELVRPDRGREFGHDRRIEGGHRGSLLPGSAWSWTFVRAMARERSQAGAARLRFSDAATRVTPDRRPVRCRADRLCRSVGSLDRARTGAGRARGTCSRRRPRGWHLAPEPRRRERNRRRAAPRRPWSRRCEPGGSSASRAAPSLSRS